MASRVATTMSLVCLITGSSRGIGYETVRLLSERGHRVYASMRDITGRNRKPATELGRYATVLELDVDSDDSVESAVAIVEKREGRVDAVVNNAGFGVCSSVEE